MKKLLTAAAFAVAAMSTAAYGAAQDFNVNNQTGQAVMTLNVSPTSSDQWGEDILGVDVLADGESAAISFDRAEDECVWDIRVTYEDGATGDWRGINLCETTDVNLVP
jgi:opacity protein-like surface antigen